MPHATRAWRGRERRRMPVREDGGWMSSSKVHREARRGRGGGFVPPAASSPLGGIPTSGRATVRERTDGVTAEGMLPDCRGEVGAGGASAASPRPHLSRTATTTHAVRTRRFDDIKRNCHESSRTRGERQCRQRDQEIAGAKPSACENTVAAARSRDEAGGASREGRERRQRRRSLARTSRLNRGGRTSKLTPRRRPAGYDGTTLMDRLQRKKAAPGGSDAALCR